MSRVGIGTARGAEDDRTDAALFEVLSLALRRGVTVIDTAVNYRSGRSERVVGAAVRDSGIDRRDVVVMTKAGYPRPAAGYAPLGAPPEPHDVRAHCLDPRCVRHSVATSRATLGLDRIDVVYLHNVDELGTDPADVDRALGAAFEVLELLSAEGWLSCYGVSMWHPVPAFDPVHLAKLAADVAGGSSRLCAVQAPLSLLHRDALHPRYGDDSASLLSRCRDAGLFFVASAAAGGGRSPQLASASVRWTASLPEVRTALVGTLDSEHLLAALAVPEPVR